MENLDRTETLMPEMTLDQIQQYMLRMAEKRGFTKEVPRDTLLILLEEVGELAKAVRKHSGLKIDHDRIASYGNLKHEMADVLICLLMLANKCDVNLFESLQEKEQINCQRTWLVHSPDTL